MAMRIAFNKHANRNQYHLRVGGIFGAKSDPLDTTTSLTHRKNSPLEGINMLTAQKRKFALALMTGASKKDAAIKAGYSEKSARSKGSQLAKDPEIIAFIERKKREKIEVDDLPTGGKMFIPQQ